MSFPVGERREWYQNGQLKLIENYKSTKDDCYFPKEKTAEFIFRFRNLEGRMTAFYKNGNKKIERFYTDSKLDSICTFWHSNKQLKEQYIFDNGVFVDTNRVLESYYSNGNIKEKGKRKRALKTDKWIGYYKNGSMHYEGNYTIVQYCIGDFYGLWKYCSIKTGVWTYYYPNGQIKAKGRYIDDGIEFKKDTGWLYWDEKGTNISFIKIDNEYENSEFTLY